MRVSNELVTRVRARSGLVRADLRWAQAGLKASLAGLNWSRDRRLAVRLGRAWRLSSYGLGVAWVELVRGQAGEGRSGCGQGSWS